MSVYTTASLLQSRFEIQCYNNAGSNFGTAAAVHCCDVMMVASKKGTHPLSPTNAHTQTMYRGCVPFFA